MTVWPMVRRCLEHQYWMEFHPATSTQALHALTQTHRDLEQAGFQERCGPPEAWSDLPMMESVLRRRPSRQGNLGIRLPILLIKEEIWVPPMK